MTRVFYGWLIMTLWGDAHFHLLKHLYTRQLLFVQVVKWLIKAYTKFMETIN